ncbi:MAG: M20 family metallopeptidase [Paracoccaceae bacterium]|jgi:amidohydrolase|nr:M20 family metallopeptidase [Paracoccaceae bacterium]
MAVINRIAGFADDLKTWRRHLHMHPELSLDCHETATFVVERLTEMGVDEIHQGWAESGVVAVINGKGEGATTALRADMDALPMDEKTGAEWASTVPGRMHACGHDGHTTMLLGAARYLAETRNFSGKVVLLFQPAEESIGGGRIMVEEGVMDCFDVDEVYAIHTDAFNELGEFGTRAGGLMASVDDWTITVVGKGGHAAYPASTIDPIPAALQIAQAINSIAGRRVPSFEPVVISLTQFHSGSASNIIPETAVLNGTVRTFSAEMRDMLEDQIKNIAASQEQASGVTVNVDYDRSYPPTINHADQVDKAVTVAKEIVGDAMVNSTIKAEMGSEDFSYMLNARPGAFLFLGQGVGPSVHHPEFDFNDEAAPIGASFFARLVETLQPIK